MNPSASITDTIRNMWSQSVQVLSKPSVATFEQYENKGGLREALIYVLVASILAGVFGLEGGVRGFLSGIVGTIVGFLAFTYLVFYFGKSQGGTRQPRPGGVYLCSILGPYYGAFLSGGAAFNHYPDWHIPAAAFRACNPGGQRLLRLLSGAIQHEPAGKRQDLAYAAGSGGGNLRG